MCLEVADEANLGVEPSSIELPLVSGCEMMDACYSGLARISLFLCCGGSAVFSCLRSRFMHFSSIINHTDSREGGQLQVV